MSSLDPKLVEETYGFVPEQIVDYKGLRGDDSDNIPALRELVMSQLLSSSNSMVV